MLSLVSCILGVLVAQDATRAVDIEPGLALVRETHGHDSPQLADALFARAQELELEGDDRAALERIASCVQIRTSLPDAELDLAEALVLRAKIELDLGQFDGAEADLRRAIELREHELGPEHEDTYRTLGHLGAVLVGRGDMHAALPLLEEEARRLEAAHEPTSPEIADSLSRLAYVWTRTGRPAEAREAFERVIAIRREVHGERSAPVADARANLALALYELGDSAGERRELELATDIAREVLGPEHPTTLIYLRQLGDSLYFGGNAIEALPMQLRAWKGLEQARGPASPETIYAADGYLRSLRLVGRLEEALEVAEWSLEQHVVAFGEDHHYTIAAETSIGLTLWLLGRAEEAIPLYESALERTERLHGRDAVSADEMNTLAQLYQAVGRLEEALALREQAIDVARERGAHPHQISGFAGSLGALHLVMGNDREAWKELRFAIERDFERHDRFARTAVEWEGSLGAATKDWYIEMGMSIARRVDDADLHREVFESLLAWKGRVGRRLAGLRASLRAELTEEQAQTLSTLRSVQLGLSHAAHDAALGGELDGLLQERSRLERDLLESIAAAPAGLDATSAEIQALLPAGTVAIDFFVHDDYGRFEDGHPESTRGFAMQPKRVMAWLLAREGPPRPIDLGDMAAIERSVRDYLALVAIAGQPTRGTTLGVPAGDDLLGAGRRLRALLWDPVAGHLRGVDRVLVSTDGFLASLPFEILPGEEEEGFLIEHYSFVYQPSLAALPTLLSARDAPPDGAGLLAVGDVDYGPGGPWSALAATGPEAAEIAAKARALLDAPVTRLTGTEASATSFASKAEGQRWIHVATHGFFAPSADPRHARLVGLMPGLFTGLVLADANRGAAGLLTAEQVSWLDLSGCELVVLSACTARLGESRTADELASLLRAFRLAGARTIVSSPWSVADASTRELMTAFYTHLWEHGLPRHEALRRAQLSMLRSDRENGILAPARWGAFVMSGDWR